MSQHFKELLESLKAHETEALVVGAHALAYHARPRYTKDLDIFVNPTQENAERVLSALSDFGFGEVGIAATDLSTSGRIIQLGFPPNRIDLMTAISGVSFPEAWRSRVSALVLGVEFPVIGREALIANKQASGRAQDLADLESLARGESDSR